MLPPVVLLVLKVRNLNLMVPVQNGVAVVVQMRVDTHRGVACHWFSRSVRVVLVVLMHGFVALRCRRYKTTRPLC